MFARGVLSLHTAHLPVPKTLTSKSRVSITSKLIQTKGLQVLHFGHLRKTGGRGGYCLAMSITEGRSLPIPTIIALLPLFLALATPLFSAVCALFHFSYHLYLASLQSLAHSFRKTQGYTPSCGPTRFLHG